MSSMFAAPSAPSGGIQWADFNGALLLVEPTAFEAGIVTQFGPSDAVRADITVVGGDKAGEKFSDCLIFPKILVSQTRNQIGQKVLGRLGQGQGKKGQSAPWLLNEATEADIATATEFVTKNTAKQFASAAPAGKQGFADDPPPF